LIDRGQTERPDHLEREVFVGTLREVGGFDSFCLVPRGVDDDGGRQRDLASIGRVGYAVGGDGERTIGIRQDREVEAILRDPGGMLAG
jgi:hypothetical protein